VSANNNSNNYIIGERVKANGSSSNSGTVVSWNRPSGILKITDLLGTIANNATITGANSSATFIVNTVPDELLDPQEREVYNNKSIQNEAIDFVDLSESNPFGTPT